MIKSQRAAKSNYHQRVMNKREFCHLSKKQLENHSTSRLTNDLSKTPNQSPSIIQMRSFSSPFVNKHGGAGCVKDNTSSLLKQIIGRMGSQRIQTQNSQDSQQKNVSNRKISTSPFLQNPNTQDQSKKYSIQDIRKTNGQRLASPIPSKNLMGKKEKKDSIQINLGDSFTKMVSENYVLQKRNSCNKLSSLYGKITLKTLQENTRDYHQLKSVGQKQTIKSKYEQIDLLMSQDRQMITKLIENCQIRMKLQKDIDETVEEIQSQTSDKEKVSLKLFSPLIVNISLVSPKHPEKQHCLDSDFVTPKVILKLNEDKENQPPDEMNQKQ